MGVLVIGDALYGLTGDLVEWHDLRRRMPSVVEYSLVLVIPGHDTAHEQDALVDTLLTEFTLFPGADTVVVWEVNENTLPSLADRLGLGKLVRLPSHLRYTLKNRLPGLVPLRDKIVFAIQPSSTRYTVLVQLIHKTIRTRIVLGMASTGGRWVFVPPCKGYEWAIKKALLAIDDRIMVAVAACLVVLLSVVSFALYDHAEREYSIGVAKVKLA